MAGLLAYLALEATASLKRKAMVYALMALGGLIAIFGLGYALNAGYTALMFRYGPIASSLSIAGGLLVAAAGCLLAARVTASRAKARSAPAPVNLQYEFHMLRQTKLPALAAGVGVAGVAAMAAAIMGRRKRVASADVRSRPIEDSAD